MWVRAPLEVNLVSFIHYDRNCHICSKKYDNYICKRRRLSNLQCKKIVDMYKVIIKLKKKTKINQKPTNIKGKIAFTFLRNRLAWLLIFKKEIHPSHESSETNAKLAKMPHRFWTISNKNIHYICRIGFFIRKSFLPKSCSISKLPYLALDKKKILSEFLFKSRLIILFQRFSVDISLVFFNLG